MTEMIGKPTQQEKILRYLCFHDFITTMDGFTKLNLTKLTTRVSELRDLGFDIQDEWVGNKEYKKYFLGENDKKYYTQLFSLIDTRANIKKELSNWKRYEAKTETDKQDKFIRVLSLQDCLDNLDLQIKEMSRVKFIC